MKIRPQYRISKIVALWLCLKYRVRYLFYKPDPVLLHESRKEIKARLNKNSWPCSDKSLFFPSMIVVDKLR